MTKLPNGVIAFDEKNPNLVETSTNLASVKIENFIFKILTLLRSCRDSKRNDLAKNMQEVAENFGAEVLYSSAYPAWEPENENELTEIFSDIGSEIYGKKPKIEIIHAGLECGILGRNYPHWKMVSFGPTIENPHSPDERVHIASVERSFDWLYKALLVIAHKNI